MEFTEEDDWEDDYKVNIEGLLSRGMMEKPRLEVKRKLGEQEHGVEGGLYLVPAKECSGMILLEEEGGEDTRLDVKRKSGEQEQQGWEGGLYLVPAKECSG